MTKGGKREGAGRKARTPSPTIVRGIRFTEDEWEEIKRKAIAEYHIYGCRTPSEYIRLKTLSK